MGWAQRSKQQRRAAGESTTCGNPEPLALTSTFIKQDAFDAAVKAGQAPKATYSDREYAMDAKGQLRRLPPTAVVGELRYGQMHPK